MEIEYSFARAPFERLSQSFRSIQKLASKEVSNAVRTVRETPVGERTRLVDQLKQLRESMHEALEIHQIDVLQQMNFRAQYLQRQYSSAEIQNTAESTRMLIRRLVCSHLMGQGFFKSADCFLEESHLSEKMVDRAVCKSAADASDALLERHDCTLALQW